MERVLQKSGMAWTILRPHVFMQNLVDMAPTIAREGKIRAASGDGKIPFIDTRDIAAVAAVALTALGHEGKKYVLTGPEALSYGDVARTIGNVIGRPVDYVAESPEETRERLVRAGGVALDDREHARLGLVSASGRSYGRRLGDRRELLGRLTRSLARFVENYASVFRDRSP